MDENLIIVKIITLLYRESQIEQATENSAALALSILNTIEVAENTLGMETSGDTTLGLKHAAIEMAGAPQGHKHDATILLQRIKVIAGHMQHLYDAVRGGIEPELSQERIIALTQNIKATLRGHTTRQEAEKKLSQALYQLRYQPEKVPDIQRYVSDLRQALEPLESRSSQKDPAVMDEIDFGDQNAVSLAVKRALAEMSGGDVLVTGWQDLNEMLQGGFRPGTITIINALQHKYKTGFSLSLFRHFVAFNRPRPSKRIPTALRISFEDSIGQNTEFLFKEIKHSETGEFVDTTKYSTEEISEYVSAAMAIQGWNVHLVRVDPTRWTYRDLIDYILGLEAKGFDIQILMIDYLGMLPTTGCNTTGPTGTDMRDLFRRIRNFGAERGMYVFTPHQLSTESKNLLRGGMVPERKFGLEVTEKGYTSGSKQLDQEVDCELYIHKFIENRRPYLSVTRGKHRLPSILADQEAINFYLPFPYRMPIPADYGKEYKISMRKLPSAAMSMTNEAADLF